MPRPLPAAAKVHVDVHIDRVGDGLDTFVEQMARNTSGHSAPGGSLRLTAPAEARPNNRLAPERSLELQLRPDTLYVSGFDVGGRQVAIRDGGERYPSRPLSVLNQAELNALIRNFHAFVEAQPNARPLELSLTAPPRGLERLPDLVAMIAEGARFPAIRDHLRSLERGGTGNDEVLERALVEWDDRWAAVLSAEERARYDFSRLIPSHYTNNWEKRFREGDAAFGLDRWG